MSITSTPPWDNDYRTVTAGEAPSRLLENDCGLWKLSKLMASLHTAVPTVHELDGCSPDISPAIWGAYLGQRSVLCTSPLSHELQNNVGAVLMNLSWHHRPSNKERPWWVIVCCTLTGPAEALRPLNCHCYTDLHKHLVMWCWDGAEKPMGCSVLEIVGVLGRW